MAFSVNDLYKTFKFKVAIDGITVAAFTKLTGLGVSVEKIPYRAGNEALTTTTGIPTFTNYDNITLSRGVVDDLEFMDWMFTVASTDTAPPTLVNAKRSLTITLIKDDGTDGTSWQISGASPVSYKINDLDGLSGDFVVETLELSYAGFKRIL